MDQYKSHFGLRWLLKRCDIYPNAYYNYLKDRKKGYYQNKRIIQDRIQDIFHATGGIIGYRGMAIFLARDGILLSKTTVHKVMNKELKLYCIAAKKKPRYIEGTKHETFPNLLSQNFRIEQKNRVWCTDFTYIRSWDGKFQYNCSILDLSDRSIVATKTSRMMTSKLAIETLETAMSSQKKRPKGLILHSDQGSQFASYDFTQYCLENEITQSMSKAGCPYDNAVMERFFRTLKFELIHRFHFKSDKQLETAISEYVFGWYNQIRPHSSNGYKTPLEVRNT